MGRAPTDFAGHRRVRRRARVVTLLAALPILGTAASAAAMLAAGGDTRPGILPFLATFALMALAWPVVVPAWRASRDARPVVQSLDPTPGEIHGVPELDTPPREHPTFTGAVDPPVRW